MGNASSPPITQMIALTNLCQFSRKLGEEGGAQILYESCFKTGWQLIKFMSVSAEANSVFCFPDYYSSNSQAKKYYPPHASEIQQRVPILEAAQSKVTSNKP